MGKIIGNMGSYKKNQKKRLQKCNLLKICSYNKITENMANPQIAFSHCEAVWGFPLSKY